MINFQLHLKVIVDTEAQVAKIATALSGTETRIYAHQTLQGFHVDIAMTSDTALRCVETMSEVAFRLKSLHFVQQD